MKSKLEKWDKYRVSNLKRLIGCGGIGADLEGHDEPPPPPET